MLNHSRSHLIVGAGLCGLWIVERLRMNGDKLTTVLEKSRGVGGRLATRRTDSAKFDHGAQFYSLKPEMAQLHSRFKNHGLVEIWFEERGVDKVVAPLGMTALAKNLAEGVDIRLSEKVISLKANVSGSGARWTVSTDSGLGYEADNVILTSPVPQSMEILSKSSISFPDDLRELVYAPALVGLFEGVSGGTSLFKTTQDGLNGYVETVSPEIHSIADQKQKGVSRTSAWTVTMSPKLSAELFDFEDSDNLNHIVASLRKLAPDFKFEQAQLKKWRYCHSLKTYHAPFLEVHPGLYLAGDAFGRPSLIGAVVSADALAAHLCAQLSAHRGGLP